jgi:hypothetical protein
MPETLFLALELSVYRSGLARGGFRCQPTAAFDFSFQASQTVVSVSAARCGACRRIVRRIEIEIKIRIVTIGIRCIRTFRRINIVIIAVNPRK